jgi:chromosome segregation ATPase
MFGLTTSRTARARIRARDERIGELLQQRDTARKERDAFKYAAEQAAEKYTDTAIVNDCLTEDLVKVREQLVETRQVEGALARQIHEMAQPVEPTGEELDEITRLTRELDSERKRADRLQRKYDDAVGLKRSGIEDSGRWQPGYKTPNPKADTA